MMAHNDLKKSHANAVNSEMKVLNEWLGSTPKLMLIDLDGTLVDSAGDIALALNRALGELALPRVSDAQVRDWIGRGAARLLDVTLQHVQPHYAQSPHRHEQQEQLMKAFMAHYQNSICEVSTVYPGVREFIAAARGAGIRLACVTNKPFAPARALLEALNLLPDFELLLGGDSLVHKKPHPEPLRHCLRHFEVSAEETLMIGDSRNDIDAARAAGIRVLAVSYGYNHGEPVSASSPDRLVDSLAELL